MNLSFTNTPKVIAAIFAVLLAVLLFCAYKVNTNPSGIALTGFIFACAALAVIACFTKIDVVFQVLRDELEPKTGTGSGSVSAIEPYRQRSQREDLEQSLVHALSPGLVNHMDGIGVGKYIRAAADAILAGGLSAARAHLPGSAPKTLPEALDVIRAMHGGLIAFRCPDFYNFINPDKAGEFDERVKAVLAHSAPVIKADRHASDCAVHNAPAYPPGACTCDLNEGCTNCTSSGAKADQLAEAEIVAAGLTAPRVTAEQIQALMSSLTWRYEHQESPEIIFAHAFLGDFYLATGFSKPVYPANFNAGLGMKYAREQAEGKARDKLWELEGYKLFSAAA